MALRAGFSTTQATFFSHLSIDTKNEACEEVEKERIVRKAEKLEKGFQKGMRILYVCTLLFIGWLIGYASGIS